MVRHYFLNFLKDFWFWLFSNTCLFITKLAISFCKHILESKVISYMSYFRTVQFLSDTACWNIFWNYVKQIKLWIEMIFYYQACLEIFIPCVYFNTLHTIQFWISLFSNLCITITWFCYLWVICTAIYDPIAPPFFISCYFKMLP